MVNEPPAVAPPPSETPPARSGPSGCLLAFLSLLAMGVIGAAVVVYFVVDTCRGFRMHP